MSVPLLPGGIVWRIELLCEYAGTFCQHKWHVQNKAPVSGALDVATGVISAMIEPLLINLQVDAVNYIYIRASSVGEPVLYQQTFFFTEFTGAQGVFGHPPMVSLIWQFRTDNVGRRGEGRMYHFGIPTPWGNVNNRLNPLGIENHATVRQGFEHNVCFGGSDPLILLGVWSQKAFDVSHNVADAFAPVKFINVHERFTSCSKRRD